MKSKKEFNFETTFPPLGHPEHHFNKYPNHPWLKTREEIEEYIDKVVIFNKRSEREFVKIKNDLTVVFHKQSEISFFDVEHIGFQIREVNTFSMKNTKLKSLVGCPYKSEFIISRNNQVDSFEGLMDSDNIYIVEDRIKSFKGMPNLNKNVQFVIAIKNLESWDGFTGESISFLNSSNDEENKICSFLMKTPENIKKITISGRNSTNEFLNNVLNKDRSKFARLFVDIDKLRSEINQRNKIIEIEKNIELIINEETRKVRRKI